MIKNVRLFILGTEFIPNQYTKERLAHEIYTALECVEPQTKIIIELLLEDVKLFDKKQHDYGPNNISKFGVQGVLVRTNDKLERLINLYRDDRIPENESIEDTWQDLSIYGVIARAVIKDQWDKVGG